MGRLTVWAPDARRVEVELNGRRLSMVECGRGWWSIESPEVSNGARYAFSVDGGDFRPDPRSPRQPEGVHKPSQVVDHSIFQWTDQKWQAPPLSSAIIYELHVGTFSPEGTFEGVERHLDHLLDVGITHVELMPVNGFSGARNWGYDGVNLYAPLEAYGGPDRLKHLVNRCHERGLAVVLDVVYNHLGPEGNYLGQFGPYFTQHYSSPWGPAVNFDGAYSTEVRRFFCDNALMWLRDYHFDGLRLDAIHAIVDTSAVHILEQLASEVDTLEAHLGRKLVLIAESDLNDPRIINSTQIGGYNMDAQWSDDFHHALHTVLTGERNGYYGDFGTLADLQRSLTQAFVIAGNYSPYRKRRHGRPIGTLSGHKFLGYIQNHDQVGNRAKGERLGHLVSPGRIKIAAALVLTSPFIPMIFQGEEWAASTPFQYFTSHEDRQLGEAVRQGRREEFVAFGWDPEEVPDPQDPATFERSKLNWQELDEESHESVLNWYRQLIQLRRSQPCLTDGRLDLVRVSFDERERWMVVERGNVVVGINLAASHQVLSHDGLAAFRLAMASDASVSVDQAGLNLPPDSVALLVCDSIRR